MTSRDGEGRKFVEEGGLEHPLVHEDELDGGDYVGESRPGPIPETLLRTAVAEINTLEEFNEEIIRLKSEILSYEENSDLRWDEYAMAEVRRLKDRISVLEKKRKNLKK